MSNDEDLALALRLQEQFENEIQNIKFQINPPHSKKVLSKRENNIYKKPAGKGTSIVDPSWEYIDPTPDIHALFIQFDNRFFWGKLKHVEVRWSPRMTSCAGVCCYEGRGGLCSIRLSVPLLKLRPRKDLVETLLHEMIHAYLFVTHNNRDRDGHGPEFHKHMYRINKETGTNITVYHSFHDEVKLYQQHWWRCNGPCQKRPPFFGMVKRSMNRAPGPSDFWWKDHDTTCGGSYIKVREPPGFSDKNAKKSTKKGSQETVTKTSDICNFFNGNNGAPVKGNKMNSVIGFSDLNVPNYTDGNGNQRTRKEPAFPANLNKINNVVGFSDMSVSGNAKKKNTNISSSKGYVLGSEDKPGHTSKKTKNTNVTVNKPNGVESVPKTKGNSSGTSFKSPVNNGTNKGPFSGKTGGMGGMLSNKGSGTLVVRGKGQNKDEEKPTDKSGVQSNFVPFSGVGHRLGISETKTEVTAVGKQSIKSPILNRDNSLKTKNYPNSSPEKLKSYILNVSSPEKGTFLKRHSSGSTTNVDVKRSKNDSLVDLTTDSELNVELVNCPVCSQKVNEREINQHLDVCINSTNDFGQNGSVTGICEHGSDKCPPCKNEVSEFEHDAHLNICQANPSNNTETDSSKVKCPACNVEILKNELNTHLDVCLGSIFGNAASNEGDKTQGSSKENVEKDDGKYPCPCCAQFFEDSKMNSHLDHCLAGVWDEFPSTA